ncbi:MAG: single-stranded-DNA-specific exonuclease RecJ [Filifactor alocis]|nr:single-stranded-DNA-specific exonuclease RecJ [Filifactor alocis]
MSNYWSLKNKARDEKGSEQELIYKIIRERGIEDIEEYFEPTDKSFHDPFLMKDMEKAVERIRFAVANSQKITVYGDYDADGISASSILQLYFKQERYQFDHYVPDRRKEGYGLNKSALEKLRRRGTELVITVDCGISGLEEARFAKELGLDMIITDHHQCREDLPEAVAVIDPHRKDCSYPYRHLCGAGIAFKLVQALSGRKATGLEHYLEIAALATVGDIVELTGENRAIVKLGLESINTRGYNPGIKCLREVSGLSQTKIDAYHIGYMLAPRINASGRIGSAESGIGLLTAQTCEQAMIYAVELNEYNRERQAIEEEIVTSALQALEADRRYLTQDVVVVAAKGWNEGVIGIVASRLTEKYYKPSFVISIREDGVGKGSGRSIPSLHLFEAMTEIEEVFLGFGGHSQAAGLSIEEDRIEEFRRRINEVAGKKLTVRDRKRRFKAESLLGAEMLNFSLLKEVSAMEPFGMKNPRPLFIVQGAELTQAKRMGKNGEHFSALLGSHRLVGFQQGNLVEEWKREPHSDVDLLVSIEENEYRGTTYLQSKMRDFKLVSRTLDLQACMRFADQLLKLGQNCSSSNAQDEGPTVLRRKDKERVGSLNFAHEEELQREGICFVVGLPQVYRDMTTFVSYAGLEQSEVKFCPEIEKIDTRGYNSIIICDSLAWRLCRDLVDTEKFLLHPEFEENSVQAVQFVQDVEAIRIFLDKLVQNERTLISRTKLETMDVDARMRLLLCLKLFEKHSLIEIREEDGDLKINVGSSSNMSWEEELRRINEKIVQVLEYENEGV